MTACWVLARRSHRGRFPPTTESPPLPDTQARARAFCSIHSWFGGSGRAAEADEGTDSGPELAWASHASRFAVGRDWAACENVTGWARLLPAPDADFAAEPLLV